MNDTPPTHGAGEPWFGDLPNHPETSDWPPSPPAPAPLAASSIPAINWRTLLPDDAAEQWYLLDEWVTWLRLEYGLPPTIVPPLWHRHPELVWELSALHLLWLSCFSLGALAQAPVTFHRYFAEARTRLREWVATCGTRLDRDRPTRRTTWPGEAPAPMPPEHDITDRQADFDAFVADDVARRAQDLHDRWAGFDDLDPNDDPGHWFRRVADPEREAPGGEAGACDGTRLRPGPP